MRPIPFKFSTEHLPLTWGDVQWAMNNGLWGWSDAVNLALSRMLEGAETELELELGSLGKSDAHEVHALVDKLADLERGNLAHSKSKWLYLSLAWLYEQRLSISDPLSVVEEIYADFDYPEEVAAFVRYMPPTDGYDPSRKTAQENHDRLINLWASYLNQARASFVAPPASADVAGSDL